MATVELTDAGSWLRSRYERDIVRFAPWDTHVTQTGAEGGADGSSGAEIQIDTEANRYTICANVKGDGSTYLGCMAKSRKFRPGENWHRGNDLPDGSMTDQTWWAILGAILGYEIQRSQRKVASEQGSLTPEEDHAAQIANDMHA